jgi:hypothetical protein
MFLSNKLRRNINLFTSLPTHKKSHAVSKILITKKKATFYFYTLTFASFEDQENTLKLNFTSDLSTCD